MMIFFQLRDKSNENGGNENKPVILFLKIFRQP